MNNDVKDIINENFQKKKLTKVFFVTNYFEMLNILNYKDLFIYKQYVLFNFYFLCIL